MTGKNWILFGIAGVAGAAALSVWAVTGGTPPVLRTTASLTGAAQRPLTQLPAIDVLPLSGAHLVNLAMGRNISDTNFPKQVLALTIDCNLAAANLVVFNQSTSNTIATLTTNLSFDYVQSSLPNNSGAQAFGSTNELVRFITRLQILPNGSDTNALLSGVLTVAGRAHRDATTGCLGPVPVHLETAQYDKALQNIDVRKRDDRDLARYPDRTGLAYVIGVLDLVSATSARLTNTVLIPAGNLSIRRSAEIIK